MKNDGGSQTCFPRPEWLRLLGEPLIRDAFCVDAHAPVQIPWGVELARAPEAPPLVWVTQRFVGDNETAAQAFPPRDEDRYLEYVYADEDGCAAVAVFRVTRERLTRMGALSDVEERLEDGDHVIVAYCL